MFYRIMTVPTGKGDKGQYGSLFPLLSMLPVTYTEQAHYACGWFLPNIKYEWKTHSEILLFTAELHLLQE